MRMLNSSLLGNKKLRGPVVRNVGGVKTNTKKKFKWNRALWLQFNIPSSDYSATTVAKIILFSTVMRSNVSFGYV